MRKPDVVACKQKKMQTHIHSFTSTFVLKIPSFLNCVVSCSHIETQTNHVCTGAYITSQSTNRWVLQQFLWFLKCVWLVATILKLKPIIFTLGPTLPIRALTEGFDNGVSGEYNSSTSFIHNFAAEQGVL